MENKEYKQDAGDKKTKNILQAVIKELLTEKTSVKYTDSCEWHDAGGDCGE